jgi:hypothetical protein
LLDVSGESRHKKPPPRWRGLAESSVHRVG